MITKKGTKSLSNRLVGNQLNIPYCYQVVKKSGVDRLINGIRIVSADRFLCGLI
ncbi:MAG: hypothetical protein K8R28_08490 [Desulfobacterales bacterium]|nr:hypothetical protein [Desulfobacterales bacterium]